MSLKVLLMCCLVIVYANCQINTEIDCSGKPNELYACGSACQTTCENVGLDCPVRNIRCNDACYCIEGYARNSSGICVPRKDCPNIYPVDCRHLTNEHYECGSACQTTCATLNIKCDIINKTCNKGCYCDYGYARDKTGKCIRIENCPAC